MRENWFEKILSKEEETFNKFQYLNFFKKEVIDLLNNNYSISKKEINIESINFYIYNSWEDILKNILTYINFSYYWYASKSMYN